MAEPTQPPATPALPAPAAPALPPKLAVYPTMGEVITSHGTKISFTMGHKIGEGNFGVVFACTDGWGNELAAKVFKPLGTYERVKAAAQAEFVKLLTLRNPFITFVYDAFEFRDTFYIITERCTGGSIADSLFGMKHFDGPLWLMAIARCLLQAVHYLHINDYVHQDIHPGNVFAAFHKDELLTGPDAPSTMTFKLGDLGVARVLTEVDATNTRAEWMLPPEVLDPQEYGVMDHRIDLYHTGLLLLQIALSKEIRFTKDEILAGKPREMALALPAPYNFALEKALRRHVEYRTASALELWRDLHTPADPPTTLEGPAA